MKGLVLALLLVSFTHQCVKVTYAADSSGWIWGGGVKQNVNDMTSNTNFGWIKMNGGLHKVTINDTSGQLGGYAWSENLGWVSFEEGDLSGCPAAPCVAKKNITTNTLEGWARILSMKNNQDKSGGWNGWIKLSGTAQDGSAFGVGINSDGTVKSTSKYAWSDELGWVDFGKATFGSGGGTGDCSDLGKNIVADGVFDLKDINELSARLVGTKVGEGVDVNSDGSFSFADVIALSQCKLCMWDWQECTN